MFVPQETLNLNDDILLPTHIPTVVPIFSQKNNNFVETPLDDHSRSLYTFLVHKHYSLAQLIFIIAKLSSFILKKNNTNIYILLIMFPTKLFNLHPNIILQSNVSELSTVPSPAFSHPRASSYILQTVNPNVCINSFSCRTDNLLAKSSLSFVPTLNLLQIPIISSVSHIFSKLIVLSNLFSNSIQLIFKP